MDSNNFYYRINRKKVHHASHILLKEIYETIYGLCNYRSINDGA